MSWRGALLVLLIPAVPLVQARVDGRLGSYRAQEEVLYLWSGKHVKRLFPGLEDLMADIYWLRTVQYYGGQRAFSKDISYALLKPLVEITTTLDPRLEVAYRYGAYFLSEPWPIGAGDPRAGVEILGRGVRENPSSWRLRQELGFCWFFYLKDAKQAAATLLEAAKLPGAPGFLEPLAAMFLARGGDRETSRQIWLRIYELAEEGPIKENAFFHIRHLNALDMADELNAAVGEFAAKTGRKPASLGELASIGFRGRLVDPAGVPFAYDPGTGQASIAETSPLWRPSY